MGALLERIAASARPLHWLDDVAYSSRLLGAGDAVWLDTAALIAFRRKASSLLASDVALIPLGTVIQAYVSASQDLVEEMRAKKRAVAPLRTLLADPEVRAIAAETSQALCATFGSKPLITTIPSPRRWIGDAYAWAHGSADIEVGAEEVDSAAVYLAEFLRGLGAAGLHAVLLEERLGDEPKSTAEIAWYQPVINVCKHYRWDLGLSLPDGTEFQDQARDVAFVIAPRPPPGAVPGIATPDSFWADAHAPAVPAGGFRFTHIPERATPEIVLQRLEALRAN